VVSVPRGDRRPAGRKRRRGADGRFRLGFGNLEALAQLAEHRPFKPVVPGSIPGRLNLLSLLSQGFRGGCRKAAVERDHPAGGPPLPRSFATRAQRRSQDTLVQRSSMSFEEAWLRRLCRRRVAEARPLVPCGGDNRGRCAEEGHRHVGHRHASKDARAQGETEQRLYLTFAWRDAPCHSSRERAALEWTEALTLLPSTAAPDDVYERVRSSFSDEEIVALRLAIVAINGWNRFACVRRSGAISLRSSPSEARRTVAQRPRRTDGTATLASPCVAHSSQEWEPTR
jgi:hypothetical protein